MLSLYCLAQFILMMILFEISEKILLEQLDEQILNDGAHFELSPMYHCITLHKVLDSINLLRSNQILIQNA